MHSDDSNTAGAIDCPLFELVSAINVEIEGGASKVQEGALQGIHEL